MHPNLQPGIQHSQTLRVDQKLIVPAVSNTFTGFSDMPPVFATAFMIAFMEWTCIEAIRPYLDEEEHSVGTHVDVGHIAATPAGMSVCAHVKLEEVMGRKLRFKVACWDDLDLIGEGFHERMIIDQARFMGRVSMKAEARTQRRA